jgi:hypothetical protein
MINSTEEVCVDFGNVHFHVDKDLAETLELLKVVYPILDDVNAVMDVKVDATMFRLKSSYSTLVLLVSKNGFVKFTNSYNNVRLYRGNIDGFKRHCKRIIMERKLGRN